MRAGAVFVTGGRGYTGGALIPAPLYALARAIPATRASAERLGLVTRDQLIATLVHAVEHPPRQGVRIVEVAEIRRGP